MTWRYEQSTGRISRDGELLATGYSGTGEGRNNPTMEAVPNVGPIPCGLYRIGAPYQGQHTGPYTLNLDPIGHDARGRTAFRIHGDDAEHDASRGCIILSPRSLRAQIWASGDHELVVA